jgi:hypothetical protein
MLQRDAVKKTTIWRSALQIWHIKVYRFYVMSYLTQKIVAMRRAILKIKKGLAYLRLDLIYNLKG